MKKAILLVASTAVGISATLLAKKQLKKHETKRKLNEIKHSIDKLEQEMENGKKHDVENGDEEQIVHE